jgi:predicted aspartyl protease
MALNARLISERFPYVPITLTVRDFVVEAEALLDTGFDGEIIVPDGFIPASMRPHRYLRWTLVDGS